MDYLVRCYLEQLNSLPRNSLHDRRKRQSAVEYINTLIVGYSRGQNANSQDCVREAIISIIRYHEENRAANGSVCMMGKFHNILYVAVKLCYDWQLQDSGTVIALLEHVYICEKNFERIFVGAIFGCKAPHYLAGWKSDFDNQEENLRAVVYFIDHATNGGLEFSHKPSNKTEEDLIKNVRFVDLPIESCGRASPLKICVQLGLPDKVHILLRYGALIDDIEDCNTSLIESLLNRLQEFCHCYPYNIVNCLQLIFRTTYKIRGLSRIRLLEDYQDLIDDAIVPLTRCGLQVPELKHLCRCTIRQRLWKNFQLPNGIKELAIPESLKKFVDILED